MASTPRVSSSWASTKARFGKSGAPRARRRMAKRRAGAAGTCLLPRRSGGSRAEIATCALPPPRRPIVQDDRQPRPPLWGSGSRRQIFRPDPRKIFRIQKDHNGHGTLEASRGERGLFAGPRERQSDCGDLHFIFARRNRSQANRDRPSSGSVFALYAVRTFQARAPGAVRGAQALEWSAPSTPGPKSDQIGPNPVIDAECRLLGAKRTLWRRPQEVCC